MRLDQIRPGHLLLLVVILGATLWYLLDTLDTSPRMTNTILVVPLAILVLGTGAYELIREALRGRATPESLKARDAEAKQDNDQAPADVARGVLLLGLVGLLVFFYPWLGLDVAVFLFILAALILLEPRGILGKLVYAVVFTVVVVGGARLILSYPMPLTVL